MRRFTLSALFLAALLSTADARPDPEPAKPAPPKADVRGKVTQVLRLKKEGAGGSIRVEGVKEKDTQYDKAVVRITTETKIYRWVGGKKKDAKFTDLKVNTKVQCVFTGPVAESYPVQARASEVLILESPK